MHICDKYQCLMAGPNCLNHGTSHNLALYLILYGQHDSLSLVFHFCVLPYYLRHFTCAALAKAGLVMGPLCSSVHNTFGVPSLCNL